MDATPAAAKTTGRPATVAAVQSDPNYAAWAASLGADPSVAKDARSLAPDGCATTETLGDEQWRRHELRSALLASLAARGYDQSAAPPGVAPWPWGGAAPEHAIAVVDSGDTALLSDDGTITYVNREGLLEVDAFHAGQAFYAGHHDEYDFLVIFTNFYSVLTGANFEAYHQAVSNDITGLGYVHLRSNELFNDAVRYTRKPSPGRLQSFVHMNDIGRFPLDPAQIFSRHHSPLSLLGHEIGHRWLARVWLEVPGLGPYPLLQGRQFSHWSFFFNSGPSPVDGNAWTQVEESFGTYELPLSYGPLDLYLMGMIPPDEIPVSGLWFVEAADNFDPPFDDRGNLWAPVTLPTPGVSCTGTRAEFTIDDVTLANGLRTPVYGEAPRDFRVAFALVTRPELPATAEQLQKLANIRAAFPAWFASQTRGRGSIDTQLRRVPARVVFTHHAHGHHESPALPIPFETTVRLEQWTEPTRLEDIDVTLHYTTNSTTWNEVAMQSPELGRFRAEIPAQPAETMVRYWLRATSNFSGHQHTLPGDPPDSLFAFRVTPDGSGPSIQHVARRHWSRLAEPPVFRALVRDGHGVAQVAFEMRVAGGSVTSLPMQPIGTTDLYEIRPALPGRLGDVVEYRIVARDVAASPHTTSAPASGWFPLQLQRTMIETAETADPMWQHYSLTYDRPDEWHHDIINPIEGIYSWKCGPTNNMIGGVIAPRQNSVLVSPVFDCYEGAKVSWVHRYHFLLDEMWGREALDGAIIEWQDVNRDAPDRWWLADPDGGYTHYFSTSTDVPLRNWPCISGYQPFNTPESCTLPPQSWNRTIRFRFHVMTSSPISRWPAKNGWVIDEIEIDPGPPTTPVALASVTAAHEDGAVRLRWEASETAAGDVFVVARRAADEAAWMEIARIDAEAGRAAYELADPAPLPGDVAYRVALWSGGREIAAREVAVGVPRRFALHPNTPNPFNPTTRIAFEIDVRGSAELAVFDVSGKRVRTLERGAFDPGRYERLWDGRDDDGRTAASGVYLLRLEAGGRTAVRRAVLLR